MMSVMFVSFLCDFFFFKQKTAYEMRISDWSSDVCSSDLVTQASHRGFPPKAPERSGAFRVFIDLQQGAAATRHRSSPHHPCKGDCAMRNTRHAIAATALQSHVWCFSSHSLPCMEDCAMRNTSNAIAATALLAGCLLGGGAALAQGGPPMGRGSATRSEEHTSELQSLMSISYAVFCLKTKNIKQTQPQQTIQYY